MPSKGSLEVLFSGRVPFLGLRLELLFSSAAQSGIVLLEANATHRILCLWTIKMLNVLFGMTITDRSLRSRPDIDQFTLVH